MFHSAVTNNSSVDDYIKLIKLKPISLYQFILEFVNDFVWFVHTAIERYSKIFFYTAC